MRFGLAGTGHWARVAHAPALASTPGVSLDAVWGRTIIVNGVAFMGGVEVKRRPPRKPKRGKLQSRGPGELE